MIQLLFLANTDTIYSERFNRRELSLQISYKLEGSSGNHTNDRQIGASHSMITMQSMYNHFYCVYSNERALRWTSIAGFIASHLSAFNSRPQNVIKILDRHPADGNRNRVTVIGLSNQPTKLMG